MITALDLEGVMMNLYAGDGASLYANTGLTTPATTTVNGWKDSGFDSSGVATTNHAISTGGGACSVGSINGKTAVSFNGSSSALLTGSFLSGIANSFSIYVVSNGPSDGNVSLSEKSASPSFYLQKGYNTGADWKWVSNLLNVSSPLVADGPQIDSFCWDGAHRRIRVNQVHADRRRDLSGGITGQRDNTVSGSSTLTLSGGLTIGAFSSTPTFFATCSIGQIIVLNRFLDDSADGELLKSLAMDWNFSPRPYVLCCGDSLTDGAGLSAGQSWPELIQASVGSTWDVERYSYTGRFIYQALREFPRLMSWSIWPEATSNKEVAVIHLGANESDPGAFTQQQYLALLRQFAQRGCRLVCCTMTPRTVSADDGSAFETFRNTFNPFIRSLAQSQGVVVADLAADPVMGVAGAQNNATYYQGDKIHYTAAGAALIAPIVKAAITQAMNLPLSSKLVTAQTINVGGGISF